MWGPYKKKKDDYFFSVVTDHKELKIELFSRFFQTRPVQYRQK